MNIGDMRKRVNILRLSTQKDTFGGLSNPVAFLTTWAKVEALTGKELYKAQQRVADVAHKVTIRYRAGIASQNLVDVKGRIFLVEYIVNVNEQSTYLEMFCSEKNDGKQMQPALFLVSGQITPNGSGASVAFTGGPSSVTVTADGSGNFSALLLNGTYTVTPTRSGHLMTPLTKPITVADQPVTGITFAAA